MKNMIQMHRKRVFGKCLLLLAVVLLGCDYRSKETGQAKPNIVFIFTDDQTYTALHALGNEEIITPNMDRLVQGGTTFTNAYNMGAWNGAVCAASRAMIISGRSVWRANEFRHNWIKGDSLEASWPKLMERAGYDTYMTGKWHVDAPADLLFNKAKHIRPGMPKDNWDHAAMVKKFANEVATGKVKPEDIMPIGYSRPQGPNDQSWNPADPIFGGFWEGGKHWSEVLKDDALTFIDSAKSKENPFFMYLAFNAPHDPRQAPQEYQDMYDLDKIALPESWMPEYTYQELMGNGPSLRDEALAPFPRTEYATKVHIKEYYASITHLDAQIGEILDALEASGKMENTYIFFTADHGLAMGKHGLIGKQSLYDHSVRPPLVVVGRDIPKGRQVGEDVYLQDVMASSLHVAGIPKPNYVEFNSFIDLAKGTREKGNYDAVYGAYIDYQRSVRKDGFKLIVYPKANKSLLFDLIADPEEMNDLSENPEYREKKIALFEDLSALQEHYGDKLKLTLN